MKFNPTFLKIFISFLVCQFIFIWTNHCRRICRWLDPLAAIASGALLLTTSATDASHIQHALLEKAGIGCATIGVVADGPPAVHCQTENGYAPLHRPARDEIVQVFQAKE